MLAARADQENAVHAHQQAAAAKPLNQGIKGLTAKTPGHRVPKTPFKIPLNDENATRLAGKTALKTDGKGEKSFGTVKKGTQLDKSAFVTPAGPRNRAPLGAKTTNARAFQTPAPLSVEQSPEKTNLKTVSPRLRRAKVKIHQAEDVSIQETEEREVEYMPPKAKPLPDYPSDDEFGPDKQFPQFAPENMMRGWVSECFNPVDDNGVHLSDKRDAEFKAKNDAYTDELLKKAVEETFAYTDQALMEEFDVPNLPSPTKSEADTEVQHPLQKKVQAARKPSTKLSAPPTLAAKSAVSALSYPSKVPSYAASTTATKARNPTSEIPGRKIRQPVSLINAAATRYAKASAASHSTLGYAKGRAVSQDLKKPLASTIFRDEVGAQKQQVRSSAPAHTARQDPVKELKDLLLKREEAADAENDEYADLFGGRGGGISLVLDEDDEEFQLRLSDSE